MQPVKMALQVATATGAAPPNVTADTAPPFALHAARIPQQAPVQLAPKRGPAEAVLA